MEGPLLSILRKQREGDYPIPLVIKKRVSEPTRDENNKVDWTDSANYETRISTFCRVKNQSGRQYFAAKQIQSEVSEILVTRSNESTRAISSTDRITFRNRTLEIVESYDVGERLAEVEIHCKEAKT